MPRNHVIGRHGGLASNGASNTNTDAGRLYRAARAKEYRQQNPERFAGYDVRRFGGSDGRRLMKHYGLHSKYGITLIEWEAMFDRQGRRCAICGTDKVEENKRGYGWHTDHDHVTGRVRGILCAHCNLGLGRFRDNPETMRAAARYLEA